jgi:NADH-quinone oxidoreductase subunit A
VRLDYLPLLFGLAFGLLIGGGFVLASNLLGGVKGSPTEKSPYESGAPPIGDARERFSIKFYLIAVLFILFDIEVVFFFPWAATFRQLGVLGLIEMFLFVLILAIGLLYVWRKGALDWR